MRIAGIVLCALGLAGCSPSDEQRTREQARQTGAEVKKDATKVLHEVETGTKKATVKIDEGMDKARKKIRGALEK